LGKVRLLCFGLRWPSSIIICRFFDIIAFVGVHRVRRNCAQGCVAGSARGIAVGVMLVHVKIGDLLGRRVLFVSVYSARHLSPIGVIVIARLRRIW
jgi:hypothetical protein